jgi:type II secretory pathway pseudopilin PulG
VKPEDKHQRIALNNRQKAARNDREKQRGITLLEIMFVMIIATMITTAAFMYYGSVQRNKEINSAIQLIQQIIAAVDNYRHPIDIKYIDGIPQSENAYKDYYQGLTTNVVANSGFIPQQYLQSGDSGEMEGLGITTPWFGTSSIRIDPYYQGSYAIAYQIILSEIPNYACSTLERQLKTMRDSNAHCDARQYEKVTCDENTLTLRTYPAGRMYCPATD